MKQGRYLFIKNKFIHEADFNNGTMFENIGACIIMLFTILFLLFL